MNTCLTVCPEKEDMPCENHYIHFEEIHRFTLHNYKYMATRDTHFISSGRISPVKQRTIEMLTFKVTLCVNSNVSNIIEEGMDADA